MQTRSAPPHKKMPLRNPAFMRGRPGTAAKIILPCALESNDAFRTLPRQPAQTRPPCGTRDNSAYRCFLPDLTGFTAARCTGPNHHSRLPEAGFTRHTLKKDVNPPIAGWRLQGTAIAPSSTASFAINKQVLLLYQTRSFYTSQRSLLWQKNFVLF